MLATRKVWTLPLYNTQKVTSLLLFLFISSSTLPIFDNHILLKTQKTSTKQFYKLQRSKVYLFWQRHVEAIPQGIARQNVSDGAAG